MRARRQRRANHRAQIVWILPRRPNKTINPLASDFLFALATISSSDVSPAARSDRHHALMIPRARAAIDLRNDPSNRTGTPFTPRELHQSPRRDVFLRLSRSAHVRAASRFQRFAHRVKCP